MSTLQEQVQADFAAILLADGLTTEFVYSVDGETYNGAKLSLHDVVVFSSGDGEENEYRFSLYVSEADIASPDVGAKVTIGDETYRILRTMRDPVGGVWRLDCGQQYSGGW